MLLSPGPRYPAAMMDIRARSRSLSRLAGGERAESNLRKRERAAVSAGQTRSPQQGRGRALRATHTPTGARGRIAPGSAPRSRARHPRGWHRCMPASPSCPWHRHSHGSRMECITCAVIDACDEVMAKNWQARGLIDYRALSDEIKSERAGPPPKPLWLISATRTLLYARVALIGVALVYALFMAAVRLNWTRQPRRAQPDYVHPVTGSGATIYDVALRNKQGAVIGTVQSGSRAQRADVTLEGQGNAGAPSCCCQPDDPATGLCHPAPQTEASTAI